MSLGHVKVGSVIFDEEFEVEYTVSEITVTFDQSGVSVSLKLVDPSGNVQNFDADHIQREAKDGYLSISPYTKAEVGLTDVSLGDLIATRPAFVDAISHIALDNGGRVNQDYRLEWELIEVIEPVITAMSKKKVSEALPDWEHKADVEAVEDNCLKAFCYGEGTLMEAVAEYFASEGYDPEVDVAGEFLNAVFDGHHRGAIKYD